MTTLNAGAAAAMLDARCACGNRHHRVRRARTRRRTCARFGRPARIDAQGGSDYGRRARPDSRRRRPERHANNARTHATFTTFAASVDEARRVALSDAQTSGGLLISVRTSGWKLCGAAARGRRSRCGDRRGYGGRRHHRRVRAAIRAHEQYRWYALAVIMLGSMMGTIDASIANVAMPTIARVYPTPSTTRSG